MRGKVYQIQTERDKNNVKFRNYEETERHGGVNSSAYQCVFAGDIRARNLDDVYHYLKGVPMSKKKQLPEEVAHSEAYVKDFFDMIVPSTVKFNVDHYICGDSYPPFASQRDMACAVTPIAFAIAS